jgi:hypothetical protein
VPGQIERQQKRIDEINAREAPAGETALELLQQSTAIRCSR